jgi:hypothetical protein
VSASVIAICLALLFSTLTAAYAVEPPSVPQSKRTKLGQYLTSQEAAEFLAKNAPKTLFLDVRTPSEVAFVGMPTLTDANVSLYDRTAIPKLG